MRDADAAILVLLFGYIVFTTMKGNLRRWLEVVGVK